MSKYDKMVALNAERSKEKIEKAKKTIWDMVDKEEKVTIPKLMQKTGLSRGFFYKNNVIRGELDRALECQVGMIDPRRSIINHAMDQQILRLQKQIAEQKQKIESLEKENERLKRAIDQKSVNFLKNLYEENSRIKKENKDDRQTCGERVCWLL